MKLSAACFRVWAGIAVASSLSPVYALGPQEVLILVNRDTGISSEIARMYQRLRNIPAENTLRLALGNDRHISRETYRTKVAPPVKKYLTEHPAIKCILTTSGFPYVILPTAGTEDGASVDNELAAVMREEPKDWNRWQPNPLYLRGQNSIGYNDPRAFQMVFAMRLDGPDLKTITRMVEDAIATEAAGLAGPVFGDTQGLTGKIGTQAMDLSIRRAIDRLSGAGFPATIDMNEADWKQPVGGVGEQAAGAAFYLGWYNLGNFQDIFGKQGLARGSIAWHIASGEAVNLWDANSKGWCVNLMRRGAAVTIGPAFEPYLSAFPKAEIFVEGLLMGRSVVESYWLSLPHVSWAMVILGDPLYQPFASKPRPALVARAYVTGNESHVPELNQTSSMLVQLQCIGPPGSGTPALNAAVEAGLGIATASGTVPIPALHAGQTAVVRIPAVRVKEYATGLFRVHLNTQSENESSRRIVVEGRTGFSTISGGVTRQSEMFVSPSGELVISGQPGNTYLTETTTLQTQRINTPEGWVITGAVFAPGGAHLVLMLVNPEKKVGMYAIVNTKLQNTQKAPAGTQFIRWLNKDTILVKGQTALAKFDINSGTSLPVFEPPGWKVGNLIPETNIQILGTPEGKFAIRNGGDDPREILQGVAVVRDQAVADDLSVFGGVDKQNQLWVQHGLGGRPEVVAKDVKQVNWGPISRRVLVEGADGTMRIYDGRDRSWTPMPLLTGGQWSSDENRLLFIEAERRDGSSVPLRLSLLTGRKLEHLCDLISVGDIGAVAFSKTGTKTFLLAGADGGLEVQLMALPR